MPLSYACDRPAFGSWRSFLVGRIWRNLELLWQTASTIILQNHSLNAIRQAIWQPLKEEEKEKCVLLYIIRRRRRLWTGRWKHDRTCDLIFGPIVTCDMTVSPYLDMWYDMKFLEGVKIRSDHMSAAVKKTLTISWYVICDMKIRSQFREPVLPFSELSAAKFGLRSDIHISWRSHFWMHRRENNFAIFMNIEDCEFFWRWLSHVARWSSSVWKSTTWERRRIHSIRLT
jgi:hypothetical protein